MEKIVTDPVQFSTCWMSCLILIETSGKHFRYLHPLFADFFAATTLTLETIPTHLVDPAWHQALLILATRDFGELRSHSRQLYAFRFLQ